MFTKGFTNKNLQHWLEEVLNTPLLKESTLSLSAITQYKCLRESEFYYPMMSACSDTLAKLLTDHRNSYDVIELDKEAKNNSNQEIVNKQNEHLTQRLAKRRTMVKLPAYQALKGMMHGFIDLVFEADGKYYVCDYKSSYLGDDFNDYNQENLLKNIEKNHYDLQYLIYSLALHRYLNTTLPGYQFEQHFGGVFYLYLRGMTDDVQYKGAGVYHRKITIEEIQKLDQLFSGEPVNV